MNDGKVSQKKDKIDTNQKTNLMSLEHPTTLRIFLYCLDKKNSISVRESQRDLKLNSPNSITWHFEKLLRDNLIEQGSNSQFNITDFGLKQRSFNLPIQQQYRFIRGKLIPLKYFQFGLLVSTIVFSIILTIFSIELALFFAIFSLFMMLIISVGELKKFKRYSDLFD